MTTRTYTPEDIDRLAAKLEALGDQLDEDDRATLHAVFAWAGQAVAPESPEVGGFSLGADVGGGGLAASFAGGAGHTDSIQIMSFSWGASNVSSVAGTGGSGAGKVDLSDITITGNTR